MKESTMEDHKTDSPSGTIKYPPLYQALLLDAMGCATYFIPALGEWADIAWAPISAWMFIRLFGGRVGTFGAMIKIGRAHV